jgi:hypothetical protein
MEFAQIQRFSRALLVSKPNPIRNIMIFGVKKCRTLGINLEISHYIGQQKGWFPI